MRLVLDVLAMFLTRHPDVEVADRLQVEFAYGALSIVSGKSTKPLVKSALRLLSYLFGKKLIGLDGLARSYAKAAGLGPDIEGRPLWRKFFAQLFGHMKAQSMSTVAAKFIVDVHLALRRLPELDPSHLTVAAWQKWVVAALTAHPQLLETIKLYVFVPIFKEDRGGALEYLNQMVKMQYVLSNDGAKFDLAKNLQLAALDAGKKVGIVEQPGMSCSIAREASPNMCQGLSAMPHPNWKSLHSMSRSSTTYLYTPLRRCGLSPCLC